MSEAPTPVDPDGSYCELLGQYYTVATDIAPMLDGTGACEPRHDDQCQRLRARIDELQAAIEREAPDHETTEIEAVLDAAFSESDV